MQLHEGETQCTALARWGIRMLKFEFNLAGLLEGTASVGAAFWQLHREPGGPGHLRELLPHTNLF